MSQGVKYAVVLPDGAADEPVEALDGRTPLEAAHTPHMDWISTNGRQGTVVTVPSGYSPGSDVATMSLLGYAPAEFHTGRAPLEAVAQGIETLAGEIIFRCNFVSIVDCMMADFTAGHISSAEGRQLIDDLNEQIAGDGCRFHAGVSYRHLMVMSDDRCAEAKCTPPHDIPDQPIDKHLPRGAGAEWLRELMLRAGKLLAEHDINAVRGELGENRATDIWLWGQGTPPHLDPFEARFGVRGVLIAGVDVIKGLALSAGLELIDVEGATGYLDTDYRAKGQAGVAALDTHDLVFVHIEAPDEAGHQGDHEAKVEAIERIDEHIVGPLLERLRGFDRWRILVAPDHPTPVSRRIHTSVPPPFCLAGEAVHAVVHRPFSEEAAASGDLRIDPGHELMEYFLRA